MAKKNVLIRRWSTIGAVVILVGSVALKNLLSSQKEEPEVSEDKGNAPLVEVIPVEIDTVSTTMDLTGRLIAKDRIDVYAEVTGRLLPNGKQFKDGARFTRGEALLRLDNSDVRLSLIATRANFQSSLTQIQADIANDYPDEFDAWKTYLKNYDPESSLAPLPEVNNQQLKNFLVSRNIYNQFYNIQGQEVQLAKYTVYAPFTGVVSNANVTPGALVRAGQLLGQFVSTEVFELEIGISVGDVNKVSVGDKVLLKSGDIDGEWVGTVTRLSQVIDKSTQTYKAYISVKGNRLSEGMFLQAQLGGRSIPGSVRIPANLIVDNTYLFVVSGDSVLHKRKVEILHESDNGVIIRGVESGEKILGQAMTSAREGMAVRVK